MTIWASLADWVSEFITGDSKIADVVLGWFLGLLSTAGMAFVGTLIKRSRFKKTLMAELTEVRLKVASYVFIIHQKRGNLNRETLTWCQRQLQAYPSTTERNRILDNVNRMLLGTDQELALVDLVVFQRNLADPATVIPKVYLPFLAANAESISLVGETKRAALVQILSHVEVLNGKIDDMIYWDRFTFNTGTDENYNRAVRNSDSSKTAIVMACREIGRMLDDAQV